MKIKIFNLIEIILRFILRVVYTTPKGICKVIINKRYYTSLSYYPDKDRKSTVQILCEQICYVFKYGTTNEFYFLYGFDIVGFRDKCEYMDYNTSQRILTATNSPIDKPFTYITILRDKFFFNLMFSALGFKTAPSVGIINSGKLFLFKTKEWGSLIEYFKNNDVDVFCKGVSGQCGEDIYVVKSSNGGLLVNNIYYSFDDFFNLTKNSILVIENRIVQHTELAKYHSDSVNTLRLHTIRDIKSGKIEILPSTFRVGVGGNKVDNWARGGLIIEISTEGILGKYGFFKPDYDKTRATKHPDTGVVFEGQVIPMYKEAINIVKNMHEFLPEVHAIGWDVAITEEGPLVVEGNDNWEITLPQALSRGMKKEFLTYSFGDKLK